jgi:hypothetical protein
VCVLGGLCGRGAPAMRSIDTAGRYTRARGITRG